MQRELFVLLDAFIATVETGNFSAAAQRLNRTRSAVGKSVARLEERLGVQLFQRNTRRSTLTDAGQLFYEHALRAVAEIDEAAASLDLAHRQPRGRVRVTMPVVFGRRCALPVLMALQRRYPELQVDLSFTDRVVDLTHEGVDLALRIGTLPDSSDLVARKLGEHHMLVCAAPAFLAEAGRPDDLSALANFPCIVYTRGGEARPWDFVAADGRLVSVPVKARWRLDDLDAMRDAALAGEGLARLPTWLIADDLRASRLELALHEARPLTYPMYAVWPRLRTTPLKIRAVVDSLLEELPPLMAPGDDRDAPTGRNAEGVHARDTGTG